VEETRDRKVKRPDTNDRGRHAVTPQIEGQPLRTTRRISVRAGELTRREVVEQEGRDVNRQIRRAWAGEGVPRGVRTKAPSRQAKPAASAATGIRRRLRLTVGLDEGSAAAVS
jgi:hypothetical protein